MVDPHRFLHRHRRGDWGDLDDTERRANDAALHSEGAMTSCYQVTPRLSLAVITNNDYSQTMIQLPEENESH